MPCHPYPFAGSLQRSWMKQHIILVSYHFISCRITPRCHSTLRYAPGSTGNLEENKKRQYCNFTRQGRIQMPEDVLCDRSTLTGASTDLAPTPESASRCEWWSIDGLPVRELLLHASAFFRDPCPCLRAEIPTVLYSCPVKCGRIRCPGDW